MADILLINMDKTTYPNLALEKIRIFHENRGDVVHRDLPIMAGTVSRIYVSVVFTDNAQEAEDWMFWDSDKCRVDIGGTGYDIKKRLPEEIESIVPRINYGFVTRGCNRSCAFCVVHEKEGEVKQVASLEEIWDGKARDVQLMDNNVLFDRDAFLQTCLYAQKHKIRIDWNQGLDHRLLDDEICEILARTPHKRYRFAFDDSSQYGSVEKAINLLDKYQIHFSTWYVLAGYGMGADADKIETLFRDALARCYYLKGRNQRAYVMRYGDSRYRREYIRLAQWTAMSRFFAKFSYDEFCRIKMGETI